MRPMRRRTACAFAAALCSMAAGTLTHASRVAAQDGQATHRLTSPDGRIVVTIATGRHLEYSITVDGRQLVSASRFELELDDGVVGRGVAGTGPAVEREVDEWLEPVVPEKSSRVRDRCRHRGVKRVREVRRPNAETKRGYYHRRLHRRLRPRVSVPCRERGKRIRARYSWIAGGAAGRAET